MFWSLRLGFGVHSLLPEWIWAKGIHLGKAKSARHATKSILKGNIHASDRENRPVSAIQPNWHEDGLGSC